MKKIIFVAFATIIVLAGCKKKGYVDLKNIDYWIKTCQVPFVVQFYLDFGYQPSEVSIEWDFGDGQKSTEKEPIHLYQKTGIYVVKLKIVNYQTVYEKSLTIDVSKEKMTPLVKCDYRTTYGKWNAPCQIEFFNLTQYASEFFWDFGDGTGSTEDSPTHIYPNPGTYRVKLHAICQDTTTKVYEITVKQPPQKISIDVVSVWLPEMFYNRWFNLRYYYSIFDETPANLPSSQATSWPFGWIIGKELFFFSGSYDDDKNLYFEVWEVYNNQGPVYSFGVPVKNLKESFYPDTLNFNAGGGFAARVVVKYKD